MTFGRPAMITKGFSGPVPLPVAVDDEFISPESIAAQPPDQPSVMAFFGRSLELYDIMNDILLNLYNGSADPNGENAHDFYFSSMTGEGERTIFELDHCLTRWTRSLPLHLRADQSMTLGNPIFCRQSIVLRARSVLGQTFQQHMRTKFSSFADSFTYGCFYFAQPFRDIVLCAIT